MLISSCGSVSITQGYVIVNSFEKINFKIFAASLKTFIKLISLLPQKYNF